MRLCSEENDKRYFSFFEKMAERVGLPRYRDAMRKCRCADVFYRRCHRLLRSNPWPFGLCSHPILLKRQHPNLLEASWGVGGWVRRLVNGSFLSVFIRIGALVVLYRDERRVAIDRNFV